MKIDFGDPIDFEIPIDDFPLQSIPIKSLAGRAEIKVFVLKSAHDEMINHVNVDKDIECGGVLVGYPFQDRETEEIFVVIVGVIRDLSNNRSVVHFTVTPEEISRTREVLEEKFPKLIAVGWYHSHPGHGVFLSSQDMTIVRGIYSEEWNLAWVIDPIKNQEGIFYGSNGDPLVNNNSSNPLIPMHQTWITLTEYPHCVKKLQSGKAEYIKKALPTTSTFNSHKTENKVVSKREENEAKKTQNKWKFKFILILSSIIFAFIAVLVVGIVVLFYIELPILNPIATSQPSPVMPIVITETPVPTLSPGTLGTETSMPNVLPETPVITTPALTETITP